MTLTITILHGQDQASVQSHLLDMIGAIPPEEALFCKERFDLSDKDQRSKAWGAMRTPPMPISSNPTRWVIVEGIETIKDAETLKWMNLALDAGAEWAKDQKRHLQVIAVSGEELGSAPGTAPWMQRAKKRDIHNFARIPFWRLGDQVAATKAQALEMGFELKPAITNELTRLCGGDQARIGAELRKLGPLVAAGQKVNIPKLRELVGQPAITTRDLVACVREGRKASLLEQAEQMLSAGEKPWDLSGWLVSQIHPLLICTALEGDADESDMAKLLNRKKGQIWAMRKDIPSTGIDCNLLTLCTALVGFRVAITRGQFQGHRQQGEALLLALAEGVS
jgi:hypothetical protein